MAHNAIGRLFRTRCGLHQTLTPLAQTRNTSTKAVPSFGPTSSPELEQKLNHIRQELFAPMYLAEKQKRLTFRERYHEKLKEEQIRVTIGDEEFTLEPRSRSKLPTKGHVNEAVEAMKTLQDWRNLVPLLIGSRHSRYLFKEPHFEKWIRLAGQNGAIGSILEAAKQTSRTGLSLSGRGVGLALANALHDRAAAAEFKGEETATALRHAEQAALLMDWPEHTNKDPQQDPKRQPFFISVLLELNAARALEQNNGNDEDGKVASYTQKLLANWSLVAFDRKIETWYERDMLLQELVLIHSALKLAQQVESVSSNGSLQQSVQSSVKEVEDAVSEQINQAPPERKERPTKGLISAQALLAR